MLKQADLPLHSRKQSEEEPKVELYNKGRVNKGHHGEQLTIISTFIKRESSVVVFLVDKSTLLAHTHHTLISLVFYKTPPLTKQQQQS